MRTLSVSEVDVVSGGVDGELVGVGFLVTAAGAVGAIVVGIVAAPIAIPLGIVSGIALVMGGTAMAAGIGDLSGAGESGGGGRTATIVIGPMRVVPEEEQPPT